MGTKQQFFVYENENRWREMGAEEANGPPNDDEEGSAVEVEEADGMLIIRCLCYYSSSGVFELRITRPIEQAMLIYMAALRADGNVESGVLK